MNREDRALIRRMVLSCRRILEEELDGLLRLHGLLPDTVVPVPADRADLQARLRAAVERERQGPGALSYPEARKRYVRQAAFTLLNRLLALRVAEANGLLAETVVTRPEYGDRSRRERDLADADPDLAVQPEALAHAALQQAFGELRPHIPQLFGTDEPYALLLPRLPAYRRLREEFAALPEDLWRQFETLGWAYQFFNSEEREEIRRRLRRNPSPDDIPPLNQFYTVGWIVRALVHNTLGRLWLEAHPDSPLRARLDYLVPVSNRFRPPDRRLSVQDLKVLDPACGSGHFLLGAFDLLVEMWAEERPDLPHWQIPALVLENNLYGVDIDLRAAQIAALALWLKARTAFERLAAQEPHPLRQRPVFAPRRLNIVCADIRFTDGDRRRRFLARFADAYVRNLVEQTLADCARAAEIGSLLRIRQPFERLFAARRARPEEVQQKARQLELFPLVAELPAPYADGTVPIPRQMTLEEIVQEIRAFVRQASEANDMGSLLFGLDAANAVHLVDVLTQEYDVVLMNPPYGALSAGAKAYARQHYPRTHSDAYAAFIEQAISLCRPGGTVGAITGRTFLFLKSFQKLREEILRADALPEVVWDLGFNVLDEATARYAAFTLRRRHAQDGVDWRTHPVLFFRLTDRDWDEKRAVFEETLQKLVAQDSSCATNLTDF